MIYLENFTSYSGDIIELFELADNSLFDLILENKELAKCPCNLTKGWEIKSKFNSQAHLNIGLQSYKKCCHFFDLKHFNKRIKDELFTNNNIYSYNSPVHGAINLEIVPSFHWFERLYRKSDERYINDPDVVNPDIDEAIDLLVRNIDKIAERITKFQKREFYLELTKRESFDKEGNILPYMTIASIDKVGYNSYKFTLVTHVKGKRKFSRQYETTKMYVEKLLLRGIV